MSTKLDMAFLDPIGHRVIGAIELFVSLSTLTSGLSLIAAVISVWTMQVTTRDFGTKTGEERMALIQRIAIALIAMFLVVNAITPFITPDPPWLANLPLVIAIGLFMLVLGLSYRRREFHRGEQWKKDQDAEQVRSRTAVRKAVAAARKQPGKAGAKKK